MKAYCISGLGADKRAFDRLTLNELQLVHINWVEPKKNESLEGYALRLSQQMGKEEPFVLIGLSFGGMLATEIAKISSPEKTFIISSVVSRNELPATYRIIGKLKLHKLIPFGLVKRVRFMAYSMFGVKSSNVRKLLNQIINDTDTHFLTWAIEAILKWKNKVKIDCVRIHGEKDRILPAPPITQTHIIPKGGHFAIVEQGRLISKILDAEMQQIDS